MHNDRLRVEIFRVLKRCFKEGQWYYNGGVEAVKQIMELFRNEYRWKNGWEVLLDDVLSNRERGDDAKTKRHDAIDMVVDEMSEDDRGYLLGRLIHLECVVPPEEDDEDEGLNREKPEEGVIGFLRWDGKEKPRTATRTEQIWGEYRKSAQIIEKLEQDVAALKMTHWLFSGERW